MPPEQTLSRASKLHISGLRDRRTGVDSFRRVKPAGCLRRSFSIGSNPPSPNSGAVGIATRIAQPCRKFSVGY